MLHNRRALALSRAPLHESQGLGLYHSSLEGFCMRTPEVPIRLPFKPFSLTAEMVAQAVKPKTTALGQG